MKALLLENIHPEAVRILNEGGIEVETHSGALREDDLIAALDGVDLLGLRSNTHLTERVLRERGDSLMAVGAFCIGTNQIALDAASAAGIPTFNAPYSNTRSVVELAIAEIIMLARHLADKNAKTHAGVWDKSATGAHEVRGRTLGIVGYGNIGSQLSVLAEAIGMRVMFYDIVDRLALGNARRADSLAELLAESETVSLHVDGRASNQKFFGAEEFAQMRPRSLFLNLCRGSVVDIDALVGALDSGHLAGAAIDVFPTEPKSASEEFVSPLRGRSNVILTPHIGGSTQEAQVDIGRFVAGKLLDYVTSGSTQMSVNLPEIAAAAPTETRVLHLHHNVPGVLARLNSVFSEQGANITFQTLATSGSYGYVVTDISTAGPDLLPQLERLDETVRTRLI